MVLGQYSWLHGQRPFFLLFFPTYILILGGQVFLHPLRHADENLTVDPPVKLMAMDDDVVALGLEPQTERVMMMN